MLSKTFWNILSLNSIVNLPNDIHSQDKGGSNLFSNSASFSSLSWITWFNDETFPSFCLMFCSNRCIEPRDSSSSRTLKQTEVITSMTTQGGALNCTYAIILIIHTASRRYVPHYALHSSSSPRKGASRVTPSFSSVPTTSSNVIAPFPFLKTSGHTISSLSFLRRHVIHFPSPSLKRFVRHYSFALFKDNIPLKTPRKAPMDWLNGHTQSN